MPRTIAADDPAAVSIIADVMRVGGVVALPTDTVYGVAVAANVPGATASLFALKGRSPTVPLAVLVASIDQARTLCDDPPVAVRRLIEQYWPGPLTVVLDRRAGSSVVLGGDERTVGIRCPDHALARAVAREVGPLATTSANLSGQPTPETAEGVRAALGDGVQLVVDGGACVGSASTVVDGTDPALPVLREGPITAADIAAFATRS